MEWRLRVFPLLLIPMALGALIARRVLKRDYLHSFLAQAGGLAVVLTLVGVNFCLRLGLDLTRSIVITVAVQAVVAIALGLKAPEGPAWRYLPRRGDWALGLLSLVVLFYSNAQQVANADDDYWIHAPLQGLMRADNFPPFNPFFSDIPMNGHYGRNLGIVTLSRLSGADVFLAQHVLTSCLQVLTLWLFFSAFLRATQDRRTAFLATLFVFFGINAGGRGGLIDTMQNNNAMVHLYLAMMLDLMLDVWGGRKRGAVLLAGCTLGSYAIVYETHFGLVFLTILGVTPILFFRRAIDKGRALSALLVLGLSLPLAFTQGGPLTDLLSRKLEGRSHTQAENLSKGMQNQAQVVKVTFPKKELFQILLETGEYQRISHIYQMDTPLKRFYKPSVDRGYAYIWSWQVLRIHFLPLYLLPFSFFVLWRRNSLPGLFLGAFGTISYLTPALVHFGPIYESEYYRWEFAAALGFAGALGLALGSLIEQKAPQPRPLLLIRASDLGLTRAGRWMLLVLLIALVNSWASLTFVSRRLGQAVTQGPSHWLYFPTTWEWLRSHPVLDFDAADIQAAKWLGRRVKPGQRVLVNFRQENNFSILYESTLTGLSGARCVGHALPLEDEKIGTTPFRRSAPAIVFWQTYRPEPLRQMQVDWVFYRSDSGLEPPPLPGAELEHRVIVGEQVRLVYRIDREKLTTPQGYSAEEAAGLTVEASPPRLAPVLRGGQLTPATLLLKGEAGKPLRGQLHVSTVRRSDGLVSSPTEDLHFDLDQTFSSEGQLELELPLVPPHEEGEYTLKLTWAPSENGPHFEIPETTMLVRFGGLLQKVSLQSLELDGQPRSNETPYPARTLLRARVELELPGEFPAHRQVQACWAFYDEARREFDLLPAVNLRQVQLDRRLDLPMVTPQRPGRYRLGLYLSPQQGELVRIPAGHMVIE